MPQTPRQFSESPSRESAKDEVLGALRGANHIDVLAISRSASRLGFVLDDWCPLNREADTAKRALSLTLGSIDPFGDRERAIRRWAWRSFTWVGQFDLTFEAVDRIFSFTLERDREEFTKVYKHILVQKIGNERTRRTIS